MKTDIKCAAWTSKKFTPKIKFPLRGINSGRARSGRQANTKPMRRKMQPSPGMIPERVVFTGEEHLGAQQQIEWRAHELWRAGGCRHGTALADWLQAESEVLEQFTWAYARRHALRQSSTPGS